MDLPRGHPESYHSFMWSNLFQHIDILPSNVHLLDGNAVDLKAECEQYEAAIRAVGGVELFLGGIGTDGHIAFNEPGSSLQSRTRVKTLAYETIVANARFFEQQMDAVPKMALTVGVATIMDAREVLLIISGHAKAAALEKCVEQGVNHMFTLSAIQMHPCACIVCDDDATGELRVRTVRYFKGLEKYTDHTAQQHTPTIQHHHTAHSAAAAFLTPSPLPVSRTQSRSCCAQLSSALNDAAHALALSPLVRPPRASR